MPLPSSQLTARHGHADRQRKTHDDEHQRQQNEKPTHKRRWRAAVLRHIECAGNYSDANGDMNQGKQRAKAHNAREDVVKDRKQSQMFGVLWVFQSNNSRESLARPGLKMVSTDGNYSLLPHEPLQGGRSPQPPRGRPQRASWSGISSTNTASLRTSRNSYSYSRSNMPKTTIASPIFPRSTILRSSCAHLHLTQTFVQ